MILFIDSANIEEIKYAINLGVISGITTNPSILARNGIHSFEAIDLIAPLFNNYQPISIEVDESDAETMYKQAILFNDYYQNKFGKHNLTIKLPMTEDGLIVCEKLKEKNIKTNVTLIFTLSQAILAIQAGATFISPFIGRLNDYENDENAGFNLINNISNYIKKMGVHTKIIAASIRNKTNVEQAALAGADIATIPFKVLKEMYEHELTEKGLVQFADDSKK